MMAAVDAARFCHLTIDLCFDVHDVDDTPSNPLDAVTTRSHKQVCNFCFGINYNMCSQL